MARRPSRRRLTARALRVGAVVLVVAGYLAAFGTTPTGQGWSLLPHLALDPGLPLAAPTLVVEQPQEGPALTTLRPEATDDPEDASEHVRATLPVIHAGLRGADGRRAHEGVLHAHDAPAPEPSVSPTLSLDKHRVPAPTAVPAPPASVAAVDEPPEAGASVDRTVETPPPIGRS